eukprot:CAMPEP_0203748226 /NCGR_PEP_ID=MMETSP0098-20131031/3161_1 /ASSEMBLY_ACC=CAM_ASM_000208 /TAXON_ID=96639 /ORGANISM=" , Strain NY0313808BC1" /LENGTH=514 /DNA_ID=CAMNT_0050636893 /DNA_START=106 /DNA_END=1647 /DNA_ORIENTATION=+
MHVQGSRGRLLRGRQFHRPVELENDRDMWGRRTGSTVTGQRGTVDRNAVIAEIHHKHLTLQKVWEVWVSRSASGILEARSRMLKSVLHWARASQLKSFGQWRILVERRKRYVGALRYWARKLEKRVFGALRENARTFRIQRIKASKWSYRAEVARGQRRMVDFFQRWKTAIADQKAMAVRLHRRIKSDRYFKNWREITIRNRGWRSKWRRASTFSNERILLSTFLEWRDLPREKVRARETARLGLAMRLRSRHLELFALRRLCQYRKVSFRQRRNKRLADYFRWLVLVKGSFREWAGACSRRFTALQRLQRTKVKLLSRFFLDWVHWATEMKNERNKLFLALHHWSSQIHCKYFYGWTRATIMRRVAANRIEQGQGHWEKVVKRGVLQMLIQWKESRLRRRKVRLYTVARIMRIWKQHLVFVATQASQLRCAELHYASKLMGQVWHKLVAACASEKLQTAEKTKVAKRYFLQRSLEKWSQAVKARIMDRLNISRGVYHYEIQLERKTFNILHEW